MTMKALLAFTSLFLCCSSAFALEEISDEDLAQDVAQDGVTVFIGLPTNGWRANSFAFLDKTGIDATVKPGYDFHPASIVMNNLGFRTCTQNTINGSCTSVALPSIKMDFDIVGDHDNNGADSPMLNMRLGLVNGANKIRIYLDKISIRNGAGNSSVDFMDFGGRTGGDIDALGDYVDLVPSGSLSLLNLQLGNESQGSMLKFVNGNFGTLDFGTVSILDKQYTVANNRSLRFGFRIDNFDLTGTGFDLTPDGLKYSATSFVTPMDITMTNISAGNITSTNMGTIGIKGLQVTNFALTISGKS